MIGIMRHSFIANFVLILSLLTGIAFGQGGLPAGCTSITPGVDVGGCSGEYLLRTTQLPMGTCYTSGSENGNTNSYYHNVVDSQNRVIGHLSYDVDSRDNVSIGLAAIAPGLRNQGGSRPLYGEMGDTLDLSADILVKSLYFDDNEAALKANLNALRQLHPELSPSEALSVAAARTPEGRQFIRQGRNPHPDPSQPGKGFIYAFKPLSARAQNALATMTSMSNEDVANLAKPKNTCPIVKLPPPKSSCKANNSSVVTASPSTPRTQPTVFRTQIATGVGRATTNLGVRAIEMWTDAHLQREAAGTGDSARRAAAILESRAYTARIQQNLAEGRNADGTPTPRTWRGWLMGVGNAAGQISPM